MKEGVFLHGTPARIIWPTFTGAGRVWPPGPSQSTCDWKEGLSVVRIGQIHVVLSENKSIEN